MITAYWHMHDAGTGWWLLMALGWLAVVVLAVWAVTSQVRGRDEPTPRDVLDRRLAEGQISVEEYEHLRDALRPPRGATPSHP